MSPGPEPPRERDLAPASFSVLAGALAAIRWNVVSITGQEALNDLFRFEAIVTAAREEVARHANPFAIHHELPRCDVSFSLGDAPPDHDAPHRSTRFAMIKAAHHGGFHRGANHDEVRLRLELVPRMWLLTQRRGSRIFQDRFVHEIVSAVLCEHGIRHAWDLGKQYPRRLYCTQYQESDHEFVTRLLAEEGILFYFEQWGDDFPGGEAARELPKEGFEKDWKEAMGVAQTVAKVGQGLSGAVGSLAGSAGSDEVAGGMTMVGSAFGMAGDLAKALAGQDEVPVYEGGSGQAGPLGGGDVLFFTDAAVYREARDEAGEPLSLSLEVASGLVAAHAHRIEELTSTHRVVPEVAEVRDYDFKKPLLLLKKNAGEAPPPGQGPLEQYEHHGEYETHDVTQETADVQLEQHRRELATHDAKSRSPQLRAGHLFELVDAEQHVRSSLAVVGIRHEFHTQAQYGSAPDVERDLDAITKACARAVHQAARSPELGEEQLRDCIREVLAAPPAGGIVYQNFFTCVASEVPFRPPRPARVMRNVTESATVMGPVGHDIYTDRHGRVKVQFHWDRDGRFDEHSSVWMRVTQPWAGAGYGFQFFPRVGMEVLVTFLGGDPDRPVVLGSLYNGTHPTPEPLPERMTRSGIRTQSTPKGGGFNELSFDDARGTERVYLHAERDFDAVVNHSHELKVKHAHTLEVGTRQHVGVEGEQLVAVGGVQSTLVGQDQACCVGGSRRDRVVGNLASRIEGNAVEEVQGVALRKIQTHEIALTCGNRDLCIYGTSSTTVGHEAWVYVHEGAQVNTKRAIVVAEERLTLCVGDSLLTIAPDQITIEADRLVLNGRDSVQIRGTEVASQTPGGAMVHLREGNTLIRGSEVNLTTPEASGGPLDPATHPPNVKLQFTHLGVEHGGEPIANTTFIVTTPTRGGWEAPLRGTTNASGELELHVPDAVKRIEVVLAVNTTYADLYPGDRPLRFMVLLEDSLGEADNPKGARMRLRNLGYQPGVELDEEEIDAATRQALLDFQLEAEAPRTGELDDSTKRKLRDLYGS